MVKPSVLSTLKSLPGGDQWDLRRLAFLGAGYLLTSMVPRRLDGRVVDRLVRSPLVVRGGVTEIAWSIGINAAGLEEGILVLEPRVVLAGRTHGPALEEGRILQ
jgi:hypothetical protein